MHFIVRRTNFKKKADKIIAIRKRKNWTVAVAFFNSFIWDPYTSLIFFSLFSKKPRLYFNEICYLIFSFKTQNSKNERRLTQRRLQKLAQRHFSPEPHLFKWERFGEPRSSIILHFAISSMRRIFTKYPSSFCTLSLPLPLSTLLSSTFLPAQHWSA